MVDFEYNLCRAIKRLVPKEDPFYGGRGIDIYGIEIGLTYEDIEKKFKGELSGERGWFTSYGRFVKEGLNYDWKDEFIVASAVSYIDTEDTSYWKTGLGYRHCDVLNKYRYIVDRNPLKQGFFTSEGRWVDRDEAKHIAIWNGQVKKEDIHSITQGLFSEDLW